MDPCSITEDQLHAFVKKMTKHASHSPSPPLYLPMSERIMFYLPRERMKGWTVMSQLGQGSKGIVFGLKNVAGARAALKVCFEKKTGEIRKLRKFEKVGLAPALLDQYKTRLFNRNVHIILMEQIDVLLKEMILKHTDDISKIRALAQDVDDVMEHMQQAGLKHGDFHHENFAFINGHPVMIDFGSSIGGVFQNDAQRFLTMLKKHHMPHYPIFYNTLRHRLPKPLHELLLLIIVLLCILIILLVR